MSQKKYVNVPSRIDPTAAPPDKDAIIALVPVGHLSSLHPADANWPSLVAKAKKAVLATVEKRTGCASLADLIIEETINAPPDWQRKFNLDRGAILGLSHDFFNVLSFRPRTRAVAVENAYFVGASTHPGTGVPIVLAGAKITAEQILGDRKMAVPWLENKYWREKVQEEGDPTLAVKDKNGKLDRIRKPFWVDDWQFFLGGIIMALVVMVLYYSGAGAGGVSYGRIFS